MSPTIAERIFSTNSSASFEAVALEVFKFQFEHNQVYRSFCDLLYRHPSDIQRLSDIPFLPIQFFKSHTILSSSSKVSHVFSSSGTTGSTPSLHSITDIGMYEQSFLTAFTAAYGSIEDYVVLALLPSYLERSGSSLVYMTKVLIDKSKHADSGFYLKDFFALSEKLRQLDQKGQKVLLIGVSFALLDLVEQQQFHLKNTIVMETGGMKGKRKEIIREELHQILKSGFGVSEIHSEYGMTELLSQAYSKGHGVFNCPPWMQVLTRDTEDALSIYSDSKTGGLNIIDLANLNSCSFIATQDLGKKWPDGSFSVLGRFDNADIRGCNLMAL